MSVVEIGSPIRRYTGLSSDTKPTVDIPIGSRFFETDTGTQFILGAAGWFPLQGQPEANTWP